MQFAKATTQAKITKEYVLQTLRTEREKNNEMTTMYKNNSGFSAKFKGIIFVQGLVIN